MSNKCLDCAFLIRRQETWEARIAKWRESERSLDIEFRQRIHKNDFSFLGKGKRDLEEWQAEFDLRERRKNIMVPGIAYARQRVDLLGHGPSEEEIEELGMSPRPEAPDHDYLDCFHEQWTEGRDRETPVEKTFLLQNKCPFYFPFKDKKSQSLDACEKSRTHKKNRSRFIITNVLVIIGVVATVVMSTPTQDFIKKQYQSFQDFITTIKEEINKGESK